MPPKNKADKAAKAAENVTDTMTNEQKFEMR